MPSGPWPDLFLQGRNPRTTSQIESLGSRQNGHSTPSATRARLAKPACPSSRLSKADGVADPKKDDQHPPTQTPDTWPQGRLPQHHTWEISDPKSLLTKLPANLGSCDTSDPLSQHRDFGQSQTCPHPQESLDERPKPSTHHHWTSPLRFTHVPRRCAPTPPKIRHPGEHGLSHDSVSPHYLLSAPSAPSPASAHKTSLSGPTFPRREGHSCGKCTTGASLTRTIKEQGVTPATSWGPTSVGRQDYTTQHPRRGAGTTPPKMLRATRRAKTSHSFHWPPR